MMTEGIMEITFQNKREDFHASYDYFVTETEEGRNVGKQIFFYRQRQIILVSVFFGGLVWGILGYAQIPILYSFPISLAVFTGFLITTESLMLLLTKFKPYYSYGKKYYENNYEKLLTQKELQIFQLTRNLTIDDGWLEVRSSEAIHRWRWRQVDKIGLTPNFVFIHVGNCPVIFVQSEIFRPNKVFLSLGINS